MGWSTGSSGDDRANAAPGAMLGIAPAVSASGVT
jgi:hypothetical protein